jgi:hypothetical protein
MRNLILCLAAFAALSACGADTRTSSPADIAAARFVSDKPPSVTLLTVVGKTSGSGAHAGLLINGSQRVIYDPAGSWTNPRLPQQGDVFFGITDKMVDFYIDYHARETFDVIEQTVPVSQAVADLLISRALAEPAAGKSTCTLKTTGLLRGVPGFDGVSQTWFPLQASKSFAKLPGVTTRRITDDDADKNYGVLLVQVGDPRLE